MATKKVLAVKQVQNDELLKTLIEYKEVTAQKKLLEEREKELKEQAMGIISMFNENLINVNDELELNASITITMKFDSKQFKEENEELYNQYKTKESLRQNFIVKELKK